MEEAYGSSLPAGFEVVASADGVVFEEEEAVKRSGRLSMIFREGIASTLRGIPGARWKLFLITVTLCSLAVAAQAQSATEYQVKAAFLFNFAKFVEWPADAFAADVPLQICVLGQDPFGRDFEQVIEDKTVNGHRLEVAHPEGVPQARACQILFIASSEKSRLREILTGLKGASVLTVGDTPGFAQLGGIINFVLDDNRVRFEINQKAAELMRLKLSARLLTVAKLVLPGD
jgi:YfiR/HmsC-like